LDCSSKILQEDSNTVNGMQKPSGQKKMPKEAWTL
jgi:hypothetical protein